jgi:hypothetical protein
MAVFLAIGFTGRAFNPDALGIARFSLPILILNL